jgi:hypothetical protein
MRILRNVLLGATLVLACVPEPVEGGAISINTATIDWNSLVVLPSQGVTLANYREYSSLSVLNVSSPYYQLHRENWSAVDNFQTYEALTPDSYMYGLAEARTPTSSDLHAEASVMSENLAGSYYLRSHTAREMTFDVIGDGSVTVGVRFFLTSAFGALLGEEATGYSLAYLQSQGRTIQRQTAQIGATVSDGHAYSDSLQGWLYTTVNFRDGDVGWFNIWAQASSTAHSPTPVPVPEPTTVSLLGAGLVGLAGYRFVRGLPAGRTDEAAAR